MSLVLFVVFGRFGRRARVRDFWPFSVLGSQSAVCDRSKHARRPVSGNLVDLKAVPLPQLPTRPEAVARRGCELENRPRSRCSRLATGGRRATEQKTHWEIAPTREKQQEDKEPTCSLISLEKDAPGRAQNEANVGPSCFQQLSGGLPFWRSSGPLGAPRGPFEASRCPLGSPLGLLDA